MGEFGVFLPLLLQFLLLSLTSTTTITITAIISIKGGGRVQNVIIISIIVFDTMIIVMVDFVFTIIMSISTIIALTFIRK